VLIARNSGPHSVLEGTKTTTSAPAKSGK